MHTAHTHVTHGSRNGVRTDHWLTSQQSNPVNNHTHRLALHRYHGDTGTIRRASIVAPVAFGAARRPPGTGRGRRSGSLKPIVGRSRSWSRSRSRDRSRSLSRSRSRNSSRSRSRSRHWHVLVGRSQADAQRSGRHHTALPASDRWSPFRAEASDRRPRGARQQPRSTAERSRTSFRLILEMSLDKDGRPKPIHRARLIDKRAQMP